MPLLEELLTHSEFIPLLKVLMTIVFLFYDPIFLCLCGLSLIIFLLLLVLHGSKSVSFYFFVIGFAVFRLIRYFGPSGLANEVDYQFVLWEINAKTYLLITLVNVLLASIGCLMYIMKYRKVAIWLSFCSMAISILTAAFYSLVEYM